jgi:hypothetical protein
MRAAAGCALRWSSHRASGRSPGASVQPAGYGDPLLRGVVQLGHLVFQSEFFALETAEYRLIGQRTVHFVIDLSLEVGMLAT